MDWTIGKGKMKLIDRIMVIHKGCLQICFMVILGRTENPSSIKC